MEFGFYISKVLDVDQEGIAVVTAKKLPRGPAVYHMKPSYDKNFPNSGKDTVLGISEIINRMGEASTKAQK